MGVLYRETRRFIYNILPNGSYVGVVKFSTKAEIIHNLIHVQSMADRASLVNSLPTHPEEDTCIGCGLLKGVEVSVYLITCTHKYI